LAYWIFVHKYTDEVLKKRVEKTEWPIFHNTANRLQIRKGDKIIFYKAGMNGKKFVGTAKLDSDLKKNEKIDYFVNLTNVEIWERSVNILDLLEELEFIKVKKNWSNYMVGAIRRLEESDFNKILSKHESKNF